MDFDGIHSNTAYIGTGVPQGSILGPLFFIIYMNDIHMASQNFNVILYADDTNLISPLCSFNSSLRINKESIEHVSDQINTELGNIIQEWLNINKLSLNVKKTKFMIFHHIPWICYERNFSEFYLFIWNQLVFNQRLQLFVQSPQPYLLVFAWRN